MNAAPASCRRLELDEDDLLGLRGRSPGCGRRPRRPRRTRSAPRSRAVRAYSSRCAATIRRQASSQSPRAGARRLRSGHRGHARQWHSVPPNGHKPTDAQRAVAAHGEGPLLVLGAGGLGPHRGAGAAARGARRRAAPRPEHVLVLARSRAARARLRERAEMLLDRPHEELWIHTYEEAAEALLREYSIEAGLDPFFTTVGAADRLAILLDRLDELPLRRHEIRGNPAGLLGPPAAPHRPAQGRGGGARRAARVGGRARSAPPPSAGRARARRARDRVRRALRPPRPDPARGRQPRRRRPGARARQAARATAPTSPRRSPTRFRHVLADELEDAGARPPAVLEAIAVARQPRLRRRSRRRRRAASAAPARRRWRRFAPPTRDAPRSTSAQSLREPGVTRFWRCENDRAQAQAVAREIEHLLAAGEVRAGADLRDRRLGLARGPAGRRGARGAQRPVPVRRRRGLLRPPRGPRRARLAADARRPRRRGGGRPSAHPARRSTCARSTWRR